MANFGTNATYNPVVMGLQLGAMGAAAGLGYAAVHRAIRLRHGNEDPVAVVKPMLAGALIGTAIGTVGAANQWKRTKYAGLNTYFEKKAQMNAYEQFTESHPLLATAGYFTPGVGGVMSGMDAVNNFRRGELIKGVGNTLLVPFGLFGGTTLMRGLPRLARLLRASGGEKGLGSLLYNERLNKVLPESAGWLRKGWNATIKYPSAAVRGAYGSLVQPIVQQPGLAGGAYRRARRFDQALGKNTPFGRKFYGVAPWLGAGMTMLGPSGPQGSVAQVAQGATTGSLSSFLRGTPEPNRYRGLAEFTNADARTLPFNGVTGGSPYADYTTAG